MYNEFLLSPSAFGAAEVAFCFRQFVCMPWRFRANRYDAVDGWRVFVDDSRYYLSTRSPVAGGLVANASRMSLANARSSVDRYFQYRTQHLRGQVCRYAGYTRLHGGQLAVLLTLRVMQSAWSHAR